MRDAHEHGIVVGGEDTKATSVDKGSSVLTGSCRTPCAAMHLVGDACDLRCR